MEFHQIIFFCWGLGDVLFNLSDLIESKLCRIFYHKVVVMQSRCSVLNVDIISSLEISDHTLWESHVEISLNWIIYITLVEVWISENELNLQLVDKFIDFAFTSTLSRCFRFIASSYANLYLSVFLIQLISSDHVGLIFRTRKCLYLHSVNQPIRNIRFVVIALFATSHVYLFDPLAFIIVIVYIESSVKWIISYRTQSISIQQTRPNIQ